MYITKSNNLLFQELRKEKIKNKIINFFKSLFLIFLVLNTLFFLKFIFSSGIGFADNVPSPEDYEAWDLYFNSQVGVMLTVTGWLYSTIISLLYGLSDAMGQVYVFILNFMDFWTFSNSEGPGGKDLQKVHLAMIGVGLAVGSVSLLIAVGMSWLSEKSGYKEIIKNLIAGILVIVIMPPLVANIVQPMKSVVSDTATMSNSGSEGNGNFTLSDEIVLKNSPNLSEIAKDGLSSTNNSFGKKNAEGRIVLSPDEMMSMNVSAGITNHDKIPLLIKSYRTPMELKFKKDLESDSGNKNNKKAAQAVDNSLQLGAKGIKVENNGLGNLTSIDAFTNLYPVAVPLMLSLVPALSFLIIFYWSFGAKMLQTILEGTAIMVISPVAVMFKTRGDPKVVKETINSIFGFILSIYFNAVILYVAITFSNNVRTLVDGSDLNFWGKIIATILAYFAIYKGSMAGLGYIDKITGVGQDHSQNMAGTVAMAGAAGSIAGKGIGKVREASGKVAGLGQKGFDSVKDKLADPTNMMDNKEKIANDKNSNDTGYGNDNNAQSIKDGLGDENNSSNNNNDSNPGVKDENNSSNNTPGSPGENNSGNNESSSNSSASNNGNDSIKSNTNQDSSSENDPSSANNFSADNDLQEEDSSNGGLEENTSNSNSEIENNSIKSDDDSDVDIEASQRDAKNRLYKMDHPDTYGIKDDRNRFSKE